MARDEIPAFFRPTLAIAALPATGVVGVLGDEGDDDKRRRRPVAVKLPG